MRATAGNAPLRPTRRRRVVSVRAAARSLRMPAHEVVNAATRGYLPSIAERGRLMIDLGKVLGLINPPARGHFPAPSHARGRV